MKASSTLAFLRRLTATSFDLDAYGDVATLLEPLAGELVLIGVLRLDEGVKPNVGIDEDLTCYGLHLG
jgi:hypothetical protein